MNRVNKCRGMHNDEWVYGYYAVIGKRSVIIKSNSESYYSVDENLQKRSGNEIVDVKADTVGQYIGVDDKNGKEIYEGDIVKVIEDFEEIYVVEWDEDIARYVLVQNGATMFDFGDVYGDDMEVIGNVHENSDLLEGEENE